MNETTRLWSIKPNGERLLVVLTRSMFPDANAYMHAVRWWYEQGAEDDDDYVCDLPD